MGNNDKEVKGGSNASSRSVGDASLTKMNSQEGKTHNHHRDQPQV